MSKYYGRNTATITEFLEARIAEDEAAARDGGAFFEECYGTECRPRMIAECAAKRAIIKQHEGWPVLVERAPTGDLDATDIQSMTYRISREMAWLTESEYVKRFGVEAPTTNMIRALAAVYSAHPDYRQEWAL